MEDIILNVDGKKVYIYNIKPHQLNRIKEMVNDINHITAKEFSNILVKGVFHEHITNMQKNNTMVKDENGNDIESSVFF